MKIVIFILFLTSALACKAQQIVGIYDDYPDLSLAQFYTSIAYLGLNGTVAQSAYLSDPNNNANYNISYYAAQANSTKTPNCN